MVQSVITGLAFAAVLLLVPAGINAQTVPAAAGPVQNLRGTVTDAADAKPLAGVLVQLYLSDTTRIDVSDSLGNFAFAEVPVGRVSLGLRLLGYQALRFDGILVDGAKEAVVECRLEPQVTDLETVVVADQPAITVTYPLFYVLSEEVRRYPANFFDPGRYATQLPGIMNDNDQGNSISVRGTSPAFFRWRLEGIEIVNPNHTANAGTFGDRSTVGAGGVNMLSNEAMSGVMAYRASDLPMRYDNTLSGLLNMQYRRGNTERRENMVRVGLLGLEAATEGPLSADSDASYLVHYRYSFTGLLGALGINFGDEDIRFQDLNFNLNFPDTKIGRISFFGVAGTSGNFYTSPAASTEEAESEKELLNIDFRSRTGILGLRQSVPMGDRVVWHNRIGFSATDSGREAFDQLEGPPISFADTDSLFEQKVFASSYLNIVGSNRGDFYRVGINYLNRSTRINSQFLRQRDTSTIYELVSRVDQQAQLLRLFGNWEKRFRRWTFSLGFNASWYPAADEVHPGIRFFGQYELPDGRQRIKGSYQSIAQLPPALTAAVFGSDQSTAEAAVLPLMKTEGLALDYNWNVSDRLTFYAGVYHNIYYNLPQSLDPAFGFSAFNQLEQFRLFDIGINDEGEGRTYGLEVSIRRLLDRNWFYLASATVYRSLYTNARGVEFPSQFDRKFNVTITGGREWTLAAGEGRTTLFGLSLRGILSGGLRAAPIDTIASAELGFTVFDHSDGYVDQLPAYFRIDLQANITWNRSGFSQRLALDVQNVTNRQNLAFYYYDQVAGEVVERYQLGLIPILSYRLSF